MAERVTLTSEQAKALLELRAKHRNDVQSDETEWVPVDEETRPHKVIILPDNAGTL